ncbi:hypothetical protein [Ferrovibrio sp.]|uniref:hypothetical protein n=1 Tax=Ferrovibrio sp. TaxID=1917215 RepID=UPI003D12AAEA
MALIQKFEHISMDRNKVHDPLFRCTYTSFEQDGQKYIQIDSYGSSKREYKEKKSQQFQLNKDSAAQLITILKKEFGL